MESGRAHQILAAMLVFYAAMHVLVLNDKPFFGDEIWFGGHVANEIIEFGFPMPETLAHVPAFAYMIVASFKLFGPSEASARLVPTLFGLLSLVVAYKIGALVSSRRAGLLAVFILVISKMFLSYTTLLDLDGSAVAFFLLLEAYLLLNYLAGRTGILPASLALGVGLLFKLGTVIVPFIALLAMDKDKKRAIAGLLTGVGVFLLVYAAYLTQYPWDRWAAFTRPLIHLLSSAGALREPLWKFVGVFSWNTSFPLLLLFGYSVARSASENDGKRKFLALCALLVVLAYSLVSHKMERYFVPAIPLAAVLAAVHLQPTLEKNVGLVAGSAAVGFLYHLALDTYSLKPSNIALSMLPVVFAALLFSRRKERLPAALLGLYVGLSVFTASVYATHDYVINECDGQREAAAYIGERIGGYGAAYVDATIGFYLGGPDYKNPFPHLEAGIKDGKIKYYAQCKAWPNFSEKNELDLLAEKYESGSLYVKSIKIHEFPQAP